MARKSATPSSLHPEPPLAPQAPRPEPEQIASSPPPTQESTRLALQLKELSSSSRLYIILLLSSGEQPVSVICRATGSSQPVVSHHLALLRRSGIVVTRRAGRQIYYQLTKSGRRVADLASTLGRL